MSMWPIGLQRDGSPALSKMLMFFGQIPLHNIGLAPWISTRPMPFCQSVNRISTTSGLDVDPFNMKLDCETVEDIVAMPPNRLSFVDQAYKRAEELRIETGNLPVFLMYSGGIDSTSTLVAMMSTWGKDLDRLHICLSYNSIEEFPEMWPLINKRFKGRIIHSMIKTERLAERGYVVTGELGDQVFGGEVVYNIAEVFGDEGIHRSWDNGAIRDVYQNVFSFYIKDLDQFIEKYHPFIDACPFQIKSCFDWAWWFNYTNKWQLVRYWLSGNRWDNLKQNWPRVKHFYDTPEWQRWSIDHHEEKILKTIGSYKDPAKKFIIDYTGLDMYNNKKKVASLGNLLKYYDWAPAIDENLNYMDMDQALGCVNRKQQMAAIHSS